MNTRRISLLLAGVLALGLLAGCASSKTGEAAPIAAETVPAETPSTRTVTDSYGRVVEIPATVRSIIPLGNAPRMVTYLGLAERVVGVPGCEHPSSPFAAYQWVNDPLWKDLPDVGNDSLGAGEWYAEQLVACAPDLIVTTYTGDIADDIQNQTGIPTIAVASPALFSEEYNDSLRLIAGACGVSERAESLIAFLTGCLEDLERRTKDIPDDSKPRVLAAAATFKGGHSIDGVYANYPVFQVLSANDVAEGISEKSGGLLVDREQILTWDPDMIFFDAGSMELVQADYAADPGFFRQLKAVQNGELYQWPNSTWHSSNVEIPLVSSYYVGAMLYPEAFADVDFEAKASEIFDAFLGEPDFLRVLMDYSLCYGKVTLGE